MLSALLCTSSSRVLLNGIPGTPIRHGRGLRQGDPLSHLLFVLAIDPLQNLLDLATQRGNLHRLRGRGACIRTSLYADDAAIFVAPFKEDIEQLTHILEGFGEVTGLVTNLEKSLVAPIRCSGIDLYSVLQCFPSVRSSFPMRYLGLPLSVHRLSRSDFQHLEDKIAGKLVTWQGKFITAAGRATLVKSVISAQATYHLTSLALPQGVMASIDKVRRAFLWAGTDKVSGGKCKINWGMVCRPTNLGGLRILTSRSFPRRLGCGGLG